MKIKDGIGRIINYTKNSDESELFEFKDYLPEQK